MYDAKALRIIRLQFDEDAAYKFVHDAVPFIDEILATMCDKEFEELSRHESIMRLSNACSALLNAYVQQELNEKLTTLGEICTL